MQLSADDYCAQLVDPALAIIRARLLEDRPSNVVDYLLGFHKEIKRDIELISLATETLHSSNMAGLPVPPSPSPFPLPQIVASADAKVTTVGQQYLRRSSIDESHKKLSSSSEAPFVDFRVSEANRAPSNDSIGEQHQPIYRTLPKCTGPCPGIEHPNASSIIAFLDTCSRLKGTKRTGWLLRGLTNVESVADHSWRMTLMVLLLGSSAGVDAQRAMSIAVVHDLAEALVGDIAPGQGVDKATKQRLEADAMNTIVGHLNANNEVLGEHVRSLWLEYECAQSAEAIFVKDMDKLEMILQAREYERSYAVDLQDFFDGTQGKIATDCALALQLQVLKERAATGEYVGLEN
jgi:putative hydrolase of HD superfamily